MRRRLRRQLDLLEAIRQKIWQVVSQYEPNCARVDQVVDEAMGVINQLILEYDIKK